MTTSVCEHASAGVRDYEVRGGSEDERRVNNGDYFGDLIREQLNEFRKNDKDELDMRRKLDHRRDELREKKGVPSLILPFSGTNVYVSKPPTPELYKLNVGHYGFAWLMPLSQADEQAGVWSAYCYYKLLDGRGGGPDSVLLEQSIVRNGRQQRINTVPNAISSIDSYRDGHTGTILVNSLPIDTIRDDGGLLEDPYNAARLFHDFVYLPSDHLHKRVQDDGWYDLYMTVMETGMSDAIAPRFRLPFDGFGRVGPNPPPKIQQAPPITEFIALATR